MKKTLLTLTAALLGMTAMAADLTVDFTDATAAQAWGVPATNSSDETSATEPSTGIVFNFMQAKDSGGYLMIYGQNGGYVTTTMPAGFKCSAITVKTGEKASTAVQVAMYQGDDEIMAATTLNAQGAEFTFAIPEANQTAGATYKIKVANTKNAQFQTMTFVEAAAAGALARPVIETASNNQVVITAEAGASIYYTLDESVPTAASTQYTAPFAITAKTIVKAIAVKGSETSPVATATVYPNTYANLADFISVASPEASTVNGPITTVYQNGRYLYLKDGSAWLLSYNANDVADLGTYVNGDVIAWIKGAYKNSNGLPEIIPTELGAKSAGTAVAPIQVSIEEIGDDMLNQYVEISGVTIAAGTKANNYDLSDGTGTIVGYNQFNNAQYYDVVTVPEGDNFTVKGFVSTYSGTKQLTLVEISGGTVMEHVANPVITPDGGAISGPTDVAISCETAGAIIFYTLNGTDPTAASTQYAGPFSISGTTTVKAIALKEGMIDSEVVTAAFVYTDPSAKQGTFDFSNPASLNPAQEAPEASAGVNVNELTFVSNAISVSFAGTGGTPARIWNTNGTIDLRLYKSETMSVSAAAGNKITAITFTKAGGAFVFDSNVGTFDAATGLWTAPADQDVAKVDFAVTATSRIATMAVDYAEAGAVYELQIDDNDAPVQYYNLQGVQVANPAAGNLYIKRQGTVVTKVLVK